MTKQYLKELADYHLWANTIACEWLNELDLQYWKQHVVSSFNSIQETVLHIISAENTWLQRFQQKEKIDWLQDSFDGTKEQHIELWKKTSTALKDWMDAFDESRLLEHLQFKKYNNEVCSMPYYQLMAHVVNHTTYHRGQLVTMLRQTGYKHISSTDLLAYYRNK